MVLQLKHDTNGHSELTTEPKSVENHYSFDQIFAPKSSPLCRSYSPLSPSDSSSIGIAFRKPLAPSAEHVAISRSNVSVAQGNSFMATFALTFHWHFFLHRRPATTIQQGGTDSRATSNSETFCNRSQDMLPSPAMQAVAVDSSEASM